jgi:hypothetical protein
MPKPTPGPKPTKDYPSLLQTRLACCQSNCQQFCHTTSKKDIIPHFSIVLAENE